MKMLQYKCSSAFVSCLFAVYPHCFTAVALAGVANHVRPFKIPSHELKFIFAIKWSIKACDDASSTAGGP